MQVIPGASAGAARPLAGVCRAKAELDALFPLMSTSGIGVPNPLSDASSLPEIPGYEVEAILCMAGMGIVFRARHLPLNRIVALKMPSPALMPARKSESDSSARLRPLRH